jgi:hypothetical protein
MLETYTPYPKEHPWYAWLTQAPFRMQELLANVPAILEHAPACTPDLCIQLTDADAISVERLLPHEVLPHVAGLLHQGAPRAVLDALIKTVNLAAENMPALPENLVLALDCSGSMREVPAAGARHSCMDLAALMIAGLYRKGGCRVMLFGARAGWYDPPRSSLATVIAADLARRDMGATNMGRIFEALPPGLPVGLVILTDNSAKEQIRLSRGARERVEAAGRPAPRAMVWDLSSPESAVQTAEAGISLMGGGGDGFLAALQEAFPVAQGAP